jgi:hypothetical protein
MSCYEIDILLCNVILTAIIIIRTNNAIRKLLMYNVESRNTFEIWKREKRSHSSIMLNYWANLTKQ